VTGGSGFLASHCIAQLSADGHAVRATLRDLGRADEVRAMFKGTDVTADGQLTFVGAELLRDEGWKEATANCDHVLHLASPFPPGSPKHEDDLLRPAREGALRVLRAARETGVKRAVLTSSFAAIGYGHPTRAAPFIEGDWADIKGGDVQPYIKSKTLAELAAWDFVAHEGNGLELAVINPVGIFGPLLGSDVPTSVQIVKRMLAGQMPLAPRVYFGVVDVRDLASLHITAMTHSAAAGQRFLAVAGEPMSTIEVARVLRHRLGRAGRAAPRLQAPDALVRLVARFCPALRQITPQLGLIRRASNAKARSLLGWSPRSNREVVAATGESLLRLGGFAG
jgi:dihydroflavonol-4-reductase